MDFGLGNMAMQRYCFRSGLELIQVISPLLHHLPPLWQVCGAVIGAPVEAVEKPQFHPL